MSEDANSNANVFQQILRNGMEAIYEIVDEKREETLHLEFKTLSTASATNLAKDDRKLLAKAVCGLANAEGGTLVVGIKTVKEDGLDVAATRQPIPNFQRLRSQTTAALPEMLSPQHPGITVGAIADDKDASAGYLIIDVPPSEQRPHMSLKEHRYFRRGSDGTRVLEHSEVRELMFTIREGALSLDYVARPDFSSGDLRFSISLVIVLRNIGRVPIVAPYIRVDSAELAPAEKVEGLSRRLSANGNIGIYGSRDILVHPDDDIGIAEIKTGLDFRRTGQNDLKYAIHVVQNNAQSFQMMPYSDMPPMGYHAKDKPIAVSGFFGAENAAARPFTFKLDRTALLELFLQHRKL